MTHVLTSRQCELILSGFTRHHYPNANAVPVAIITLMTTFFNMWQHFRFTKEQLEKLRNVSPDHETFILLHDVEIIPNISISLGIRVSVVYHSKINTGQYDVHFSLDFAESMYISVIGGYFDIQWKRAEFGYVHFSRSIDHIYDGLVQLEEVMPLSECRSLTDFAFSIYFDVQQIKFADWTGIENIDNLSPLRGCGRYQWIIEGEELLRLKRSQYISVSMDGWNLFLSVKSHFVSNATLHLNASFKPLEVSGFETRITGMCTVTDERCGNGYNLRRKAGKSRRIEFQSSGVHLAGFCYSDFEIDLDCKSISKASSITFEMEWEIVSVNDLDCNAVDKSAWRDSGICMECKVNN